MFDKMAATSSWRNLSWFMLLYVSCLYLSQCQANACRVGSEKLKSYTKKSIERLLDPEQLESFYWDEEPLNEVNLSKVTGLNITLAETRFNLDEELAAAAAAPTVGNGTDNGMVDGERGAGGRHRLLRDIFVTCSADRDRSYTLTLNLELNNPFKVIDLHFKQNMFDGKHEFEEAGLFRIRLPKSALMVQLNQRISYDQCLDINYIQLAPNLSYQIECLICSDKERDYLAQVFSKRMTQLDSEMDLILSERLSLGLQMLLDQQRLDLDLYL